jgi:hypothetical protein
MIGHTIIVETEVETEVEIEVETEVVETVR